MKTQLDACVVESVEHGWTEPSGAKDGKNREFKVPYEIALDGKGQPRGTLYHGPFPAFYTADVEPGPGQWTVVGPPQRILMGDAPQAGDLLRYTQ